MVVKDKLFQITAAGLLLLVAVFCIAPFLLLISSSLSSETAIIREGYSFWPRELDFSAYQFVLGGRHSLLRTYGMSLLIMVLGTGSSLLVSILFAYPISRNDLPGRNIFSFLLFFTLLFNGGLVPTYIMWTQTFHIKNTIWALVIPNLLMNGFYVIMARNYFSTNIPEAILDAAKIDGMGEVGILSKIVIPLSKPIIATLTLFLSMSYWNDWLNGLYYITDESKYTVQVMLNKMLMDTAFLQSGMANGFRLDMGETLPTATMKMAVAVLGVLPILVIYPFISKYLTGGIVIGAVKG